MDGVNIFRAILVNISYIAYFGLLYWRLRFVLKSEQEYSDWVTVLIGIILGILYVAIQLWVCYCDINR